jgi:hypothetical protein
VIMVRVMKICIMSFEVLTAVTDKQNLLASFISSEIPISVVKYTFWNEHVCLFNIFGGEK